MALPARDRAGAPASGHPGRGAGAVGAAPDAAVRAWPLLGRDDVEVPSHFFAPPLFPWARRRETGWEWLGALHEPDGAYAGLIVLPVDRSEEDPETVAAAIASAVAADVTVPAGSRPPVPVV